MLAAETRQEGNTSHSLRYLIPLIVRQGFPGGSVVKNLPANAGDASSVPGLGRSPGEGRRKWQPTPVFSPGNPMDRGVSWATVHGVAESNMTLLESLN